MWLFWNIFKDDTHCSLKCDILKEFFCVLSTCLVTPILSRKRFTQRLCFAEESIDFFGKSFDVTTEKYKEVRLTLDDTSIWVKIKLESRALILWNFSRVFIHVALLKIDSAVLSHAGSPRFLEVTSTCYFVLLGIACWKILTWIFHLRDKC